MPIRQAKLPHAFPIGVWDEVRVAIKTAGMPTWHEFDSLLFGKSGKNPIEYAMGWKASIRTYPGAAETIAPGIISRGMIPRFRLGTRGEGVRLWLRFEEPKDGEAFERALREAMGK